MTAREASVVAATVALLCGCSSDVPTKPQAADGSGPGQPPTIGPAPPSPTFVVQDISPGVAPNAIARDINDRGVVVGWSVTHTRQHAWIVDNGQVTFLPEPAGAGGSHAWAISEKGQIAGTVLIPPDTAKPAYWASATTLPIVLTAPGSPRFGDGLGVNDNGVVAATVLNDIDFIRHALVWDAAGGTFVDIGPGGGVSIQALAINNAGIVAGCADHPFTWTASGGMVDLLPS